MVYLTVFGYRFIILYVLKHLTPRGVMPRLVEIIVQPMNTKRLVQRATTKQTIETHPQSPDSRPFGNGVEWVSSRCVESKLTCCGLIT